MKQTARNAIWWLRAEGAVILGASIWAFSEIGGNWWLFTALLLLFDISMLGYLKSPKLGAITYNLGHNLAIPILLLLVWHDGSFISQIAAIWLAHIGMDRLFGYGLKHTDDFQHTHLGRIGKKH